LPHDSGRRAIPGPYVRFSLKNGYFERFAGALRNPSFTNAAGGRTHQNVAGFHGPGGERHKFSPADPPTGFFGVPLEQTPAWNFGLTGPNLTIGHTFRFDFTA
jgi:hypothetical protein